MVYAWYKHIGCGYHFFWGTLSLGWVQFLSTTGPSLSEVVYAYFDRILYLCVCIYIYMIIYIYCMMVNITHVRK